MKFNGETLDLRSRAVVRLPRPDRVLEINIHTLPLFFDADDYVVTPEPPQEPRIDAQGKVLRGDDGKPILLPKRTLKFQREFDRAMQLLNVATFYFAVQDCGQFAWESEGNPDDGEKFFERIAEELRAAGFTPGDVLQVAVQARRLSNMAGDIDVERYMADFSRGAVSPMETPEPTAQCSMKLGDASSGLEWEA